MEAFMRCYNQQDIRTETKILNSRTEEKVRIKAI
jgi:hypothetical protein